jgi:exopolyphosphatase/pppGpp-phosphohydrolase
VIHVAVLELGSHSLKAHFQTPDGAFRDERFPWSLGHEVYETGRLSARTLEQAESALEKLRASGLDRRLFIAIATGALRDADDRKGLMEEISSRLRLPVRVLSGREEASLLAKGYLRDHDALPALLGDIGGGTLELVYLSRERTILRDSLPLGAVRLYQMGCDEQGHWDRALVEGWIKSSLEEGTLLTADEVHCTGGTVKAIAKLLDKKSCSPEELAELVARVERDGAPESLDPPRRKVFLPGLLALEGLLRHTNAKRLTYTKISIGQTFLERLLRRYGAAVAGRKKEHLLNDMRLSNVYPDTRHPD